MVGNVGFVVHGEALADAFPTFERDIAHLGATFVPGAGRAQGPAPRRPFTREDLLGHWHAKGHTLVLSGGGAITLDGEHGRYRLEEGALLATFGTRTKVYQLDLRAGGLELTGEQFASGKIFRKGAKGQKAPAR
jgi:hypothetical protein